MGLFRNLFRGTKTLMKTSFYMGSIYTLFAYFYVQEVKYQLKDTDQTDRINEIFFRESLQSTNQELKDTHQFAIYCSLGLSRIYTFYSRAWDFRDFDMICRQFHKNVIRTVLKNYQSYGILDNFKEMERSLKKNQVNPEILKKILEVKEVNIQLASSTIDIYTSIIDKQISMSTGAIMGLTNDEQSKINLIYSYLERGLLDITANKQDEYWKYKLTQSYFRKHQYNDTIFKLASI